MMKTEDEILDDYIIEVLYGGFIPNRVVLLKKPILNSLGFQFYKIRIRAKEFVETIKKEVKKWKT